MPNYSKMYCCSSLLISIYKYPAGTNITTYNVSAATDTNSRYRASPLQHMRAHTHTHTHIHTYSVLFLLCVPVWRMCCFCGVRTDYHLPFIWGHEGAICYLDNEWCSLENLPITHSEENTDETNSSVAMETRSKIFDTLDTYHSFRFVFCFGC